MASVNLKTQLLQFGLLILLASPVAAHAHDEARVGVELESDSTVKAGKVTLEFQLIDQKEKKVLPESALDVLHEKKLHVVIFDPALQEFRHEHAAFANDIWTVDAELPRDGNYWVWTQGKILADGEEFLAETQVKVKSGLAANPVPSSLGDIRKGSVDVSQVELSGQKIVAKKAAMLDATFSRTDGTTPDITLYLGEPAHVVGAQLKGDSFIHVHAMDHGTPNQFMVHATFPVAGDYRLWVQFIDGGALKVVPLSVHVSKN